MVICDFCTNEKEFLWLSDGVYQHFVSFDYLCQYLRSLLIDHHPMGFFNFTLGQGADILTALGSYDFCDPVSLIAALVFPLTRLQRYTLMIFLKLWLVGLSFIVYCRASERENLTAVLSGAIAYTFSGVVLYVVARHPNFINWAYFFPLLLSGVELYDRRGRRLPLILFVFLNLLTSFYTFYINAVLTVLYVLVCSFCRLFLESPRSSWKRELKKDLSIAALFAVGILLSSFILLPTLHAYLNNPRVMENAGYAASVLYDYEYYRFLPEALFEPYFVPGYHTVLGFSVLAFIPLTLLFTGKGHPRLKILLLVSFVMLCLPFVGRIMNGMSYATNRWSYAFVFYGSFSLVELYDEMKNLSRAEKFRLLIFAAAFSLIVLIRINFRINPLFTGLFLIVTVLVFVLSRTFKKVEIGRVAVCLALAGAVSGLFYLFGQSRQLCR